MPRILERIARGEKIEHYDTVRRRKDGSTVEISLTVSPIRDDTGKIVGASKIARDISERKQWESRQELLLRELNHRVKNTLAIIQSIARSTARPGVGMDHFIDVFEGRLGAMAAAHDQLVTGNWESAVLGDLVRGALGAHAGARGVRLSLPPMHLGSSLAFNLALAVHELASNAARIRRALDASRMRRTGRLSRQRLAEPRLARARRAGGQRAQSSRVRDGPAGRCAHSSAWRPGRARLATRGPSLHADPADVVRR